MSILGDIGTKIGTELKSLIDRVAVLETTVPAPVGGVTASTVTWTNLSSNVQTYAGGGLYKISGSGGYNAGASTVESIDGNEDGYFQFQIAHTNHGAKIGVVYSDPDYAVNAPHYMDFTSGFIRFVQPWQSNHTAFVAGDWFRIKHYSADNEILFQKRIEIFDSGGASLGEDYVTFYTHPTPTNGSDLYLDSSFHYVGAGINDVQIAT